MKNEDPLISSVNGLPRGAVQLYLFTIPICKEFDDFIGREHSILAVYFCMELVC